MESVIVRNSADYKKISYIYFGDLNNSSEKKCLTMLLKI